MSTATSPNLVTIGAIAGAVGHHGDTVAGCLRESIVIDPITNLPSVPADIAASYAASRRAADRRHAMEQDGYALYLRDRGVRRREEVMGAAAEAANRVIRRYQLRANVGPDGASGPRLRGVVTNDVRRLAESAARDAQQVAGERFDRRERELSFADWIKANRKHIDAAFAAAA